MVAGVTPGKGGETLAGLPVFDTVAEAARRDRRERHDDLRAACRSRPTPSSRRSTRASNWSIASPRASRVLDMVRVMPVRCMPRRARLHRPQLPGRDHARRVQDRHHAGLHPHARPRGRDVAARARSRTKPSGSSRSSASGSRTCVGIGGDPVIGTRLHRRPGTLPERTRTPHAMLMIGEIGGSAEEEAAACVEGARSPSPWPAFIAGRTAPPGKRMGHAGRASSPAARARPRPSSPALRDAGIEVAEKPGRHGRGPGGDRPPEA